MSTQENNNDITDNNNNNSSSSSTFSSKGEMNDSFDVFKNYHDNNQSAVSQSSLPTQDSSSQPSLSSLPSLPSLPSIETIPSFNEQNAATEKADDTEPVLGPHQPKNQREIDSRSIYISNIPFKISPWKLKVLFSEGTDSVQGCGKNSVNRVTIVCDRVTGLPKGFAYIEFSNESFIEEALNFNGIEIDGRIISVFKKRTNLPNIQDETTTTTTTKTTNETTSVNSNNYKSNPTRKDYNTPTKTFNENNENSQLSSSSTFYEDAKAKDYKTHRNSNYNFINNANQYFNYRPKFNHRNNRKSYNYDNNNDTNTGYARNQIDRPRGNSSSRGGSGGGSNSGRGQYRGGRGSYHNTSTQGQNTTTTASNNSNTNKLVIDRYHYLTPSSRVGVYNNDEVDD